MAKGQHEILSAVMIMGILIGVVGSVYMWGLPLIQKNKDVSVMEKAEGFMHSLADEIKYVAGSSGKKTIKIDAPGMLSIGYGAVELRIETQGTKYSTEGDVPLGRNGCNANQGRWGIDDPEVVCVRANKLGDSNYVITYSLKFIQLDAGGKSYKISLTGSGTGSTEHSILIENKGTTRGIDLINTEISISIV